MKLLHALTFFVLGASVMASPVPTPMSRSQLLKELQGDWKSEDAGRTLKLEVVINKIVIDANEAKTLPPGTVWVQGDKEMHIDGVKDRTIRVTFDGHGMDLIQTNPLPEVISSDSRRPPSRGSSVMASPVSGSPSQSQLLMNELQGDWTRKSEDTLKLQVVTNKIVINANEAKTLPDTVWVKGDKKMHIDEVNDRSIGVTYDGKKMIFIQTNPLVSKGPLIP